MSVTFLLAFVLTYYGAVLCSIRISSDILNQAWPIVAAFKKQLITALLICPVAAGVIGTWAASVRLLSYEGRGRYFVTGSKFFGIGWIAMLMGNYMAVIAIFRWALPVEVGQRWMAAIGVERFNFSMMVVAPTLGFAAGVVAVILVEAIVNAQMR
jgi:hypothetical protein